MSPSNNDACQPFDLDAALQLGAIRLLPPAATIPAAATGLLEEALRSLDQLSAAQRTLTASQRRCQRLEEAPSLSEAFAAICHSQRCVAEHRSEFEAIRAELAALGVRFGMVIGRYTPDWRGGREQRAAFLVIEPTAG